MPNMNRPSGLVPVRHLQGINWTQQINLYYIPQADAVAYAVGDPVMTSTGAADANGVPAVKIAVAGASNVLRGVIVSVGTSEALQADPSNLNIITIPATKTKPYYVMVADDPYIIFEIQANANNYGAADIGKNCNLLAGANNGYVSGWQIDDSGASTSGSATGQLRLLGTSRRITNTLGQANCAFLVLINQHEFKIATNGV